MKVVLNKCYGGFSLSKNALEDLGISRYDSYIHYGDNDSRFEDKLIDLIEEKGSEYCSGSFAKLKVVEISDYITDYKFMDCDGFESILYVEDGRIHQA